MYLFFVVKIESTDIIIYLFLNRMKHRVFDDAEKLISKELVDQM